MIQFNELRITPDSKYLIIDASIINNNYYENIVIDSIIIDTQDTYVANGPSSKPIYTYKVNYNSKDSSSIQNGKRIRLVLNSKELGISLNDNMLFVYAIATGTPAPDTPCGFDNAVTMRTTINLCSFYQNTLYFLREMNNDCNVPKGFINMILRLKALDLCIRTGNYTQAIKYWKKFFSNNKVVALTNNCKCNG